MAETSDSRRLKKLYAEWAEITNLCKVFAV